MIIHALGHASQGDGDKGLGRAFAKQRRIFESIDFDEETMASMKAEFNAYDTNRSGTIDAAEMAAALTLFGLNPGPEAVAALMRDLDLDGNGEVEFYEFCMVLDSIRKQTGRGLNFARLHQKQKELLAQQKAARLTDLTEQVKRRFPHATRAEIDELQRQFDTFDLDGSGNISVDELRTAMRNLGEYTDEAQLQQLMAAGDADGSGEIDFAEFAAIVLNLRGGAEAGIFARLVAKQRRMVEFCNFTRDKLLRMRKEFDQFDVDQSGSIDARELEDALRNLGEYKSQAQLDEIMAEADEVGVGVDGWVWVWVWVP
jgi:Ca2+-binding EF-hand superfamily protein